MLEAENKLNKTAQPAGGTNLLRFSSRNLSSRSSSSTDFLIHIFYLPYD